MAVALGTLLWFGGTKNPPAPLLLSLVFAPPILLIPVLPLFATALREIAAARAVRPANRRAMSLLALGEASAAESIFRGALAEPGLGPPALAGLVHNLGVARQMQGDGALGAELIAHAARSGWMHTRWYRGRRRSDK